MLVEHFVILTLNFGDIQEGEVVDSVEGKGNEVVGQKIERQTNHALSLIVQENLPFI